MPTVLITGSNRGIGLEFVKLYAEKGWKVYAAVRNPSTKPDTPIKGEVEWVKLESESLTDAKDVAKSLKDKGVKVDVVIANAAINYVDENLSDVDPNDFDKHFEVNVRGVVVLFQGFKELLEQSGGKFFAISSGAGTIDQEMQDGQGIYGATKAALNFVVRKLHFENPKILVAAFSPGWVPTEMGNRGARLRGMDIAPDDITQTVPGMIKLIDKGDKEKLGGWMTNWNGDRMKF